MPARKEDKVVTEIKKLIELKKVIIGTDRVMKQVKGKKISKIYVSSNCPESVRTSLLRYANLTGATVIELDYTNTDLGTLCKKPFPISVIGVL